MKQILFHIGFTVLSVAGIGQIKGEIELKTFFVTSTRNSIELKWIILAGFTWNGTDIYSSEDSINFEKGGGIAGFCRNFTEELSYSFSHNEPSSNKQNYYKLELASNGDS